MTSQRVRALMHVLFGLFLFFYFYHYQSPVMELTQLQLSEGKTTYNPLVSSLILAALLTSLQRLIARWVRFSDATNFLSYLPSVSLALLCTAFTPTTNYHVLMFIGIALLAFVGAIFYETNHKSLDFRSEHVFAKLLATHCTGMIAVLFSLGVFANNHDTLTYELLAARHAQKMDYEQASHIGERSEMTSPRLSALRAYALAHQKGELGEHFFTYPLPNASAEQLLFSSADTLQQLLPPDSLYANLGVWRSERETAMQFLHRAVVHNDSTMSTEYWLTGLLLSKDLPRFTRELPKYYAVADTVALPRHFAEALSIYQAEGGKIPAYANDSLSFQGYERFVTESTQYEDSLIQRNEMLRNFGRTYWWYYHYQR